MIPAPSNWLYDFLKNYEKFRPTAYLPTKKDKWTIGYGHTRGVKEGDTCTMAQADEWLHQDIVDAVVAVQKHIRVPMNQNQSDATYSLVFNCGPEPLQKTLGRKLNAGDYAGAAAEFPKWKFQAGKPLGGLEKRRIAEQKHFLGSAP